MNLYLLAFMFLKQYQLLVTVTNIFGYQTLTNSTTVEIKQISNKNQPIIRIKLFEYI